MVGSSAVLPQGNVVTMSASSGSQLRQDTPLTSSDYRQWVIPPTSVPQTPLGIGLYMDSPQNFGDELTASPASGGRTGQLQSHGDSWGVVGPLGHNHFESAPPSEIEVMAPLPSMPIAPMVSERPVTSSRRGGVRSDTAQSLRDEHSQGAPENTTVEIYRGRAPQDAASNFHDQSYRPEVPQVDMWKLYLDPALREDKESVQQWNSDLDSLLLFAALFSAVLTAFIIESYKNLSMDSGNASVELLQAILVTLQTNGSAPSSSFAAPDISHFAPTGSAIRVNIYWFASLIISLSTALIAILAKQWLNYLLAGLSPVPSVQGRQRQYRMDGMLKWKLPDLLSFLPALLHIALLLFFAGLVDFVWYINRSVALVSFVLVVAAFLVYSSTIVLSCLYPDCPFKTSVTVLLSVIHQHLRFIYKQLLVGFGVLEDLLPVIRKHCGLWFRLRRHVKGRSLTHAIAEVWRNRNAQVKALNDNPGVHFSALKSKDEEVVSQNSSILDTRSLIWLIHNSARLVDSQKLVHAIISFPHIVSHRQLLVDGGTALFLEKLVLDWYTTGDQLINLSKDPVRYSDFVHCIGVLGALVCEAEATDEAYATKAIVGTSGLEDVPFLSITSSQNTAIIPASLDAGPCSFALVYQLFSEFEQLPLLVASYTLRLTARLAEPNAEWIWKHFGDKQIHERFFAKILQADWRTTPKRDLHAAVTTMIHLALCDTIRNQRGESLGSADQAVYYWLASLNNIVLRVPIDGMVRCQVCWAICALSWSLSPQHFGLIREPLVPKLSDSRPILKSFADLFKLSCDQDFNVLNSALLLTEEILLRSGDNHKERDMLCEFLQATYPPFMTDLCARVHKGQFGSQQISRLAVSVTRISAFLSFHMTNQDAEFNFPLISTTLQILAHIAGEIGDTPGWSVQTARNRHWAYFSVGRIMILGLKKVPFTLKHLDGVFHDDILESKDAAHALVSALHAITGSNPYTAPDDVIHIFYGILENLLVRGSWDWASSSIVVDMVEHRPSILDGSLHFHSLTGSLHMLSLVVGNISRIAVDFVLSSDQYLNIVERMISGILGRTFAPFLRRLVETMHTGALRDPHFPHIIAAIAKISISVAFYDMPRSMPNQDVLRATVDLLCTAATPHDGNLLDMEVRKHAYRTLGHIALLHAIVPDVAQKLSMTRPFFHDEIPLEEVAISFVRILIMECAFHRRRRIPSHCARCDITDSMIVALPLYVVNGALQMLQHLFTDDSREAAEIRDVLIDHQAHHHLQYLAVWGGSSAQLCSQIVDTITDSGAITPDADALAHALADYGLMIEE